MSFLNPIWLLALPLVLLPLLIHLWNQRRHKVLPWGAMQFLLTAQRLSRGWTRLRHWLIMAARMLAVAGLIFLVTRPLATGWLGGLSGGRPATVLLILDRSASMQQQLTVSGESKLKTGLVKLVAALEALDGGSQIFVLDSSVPASSDSASSNSLSSTTDTGNPNTSDSADRNVASTDDPSLADSQAAASSSTGVNPSALPAGVVRLQRPQDLLDLPAASPTEGTSDIPALLQRALDFITVNQAGRTDLWILSDASESDWRPASSRWRALNQAYSRLEGIRFHFLNYNEPPQDNLAIRVDRWERAGTPALPELILDLSVQRSATSSASGVQEVPVTIQVGGVRSVVNVALESSQAQVVGHRIPLDAASLSGWGSVELPADSNPSDNRFYFSYAEPAPWQTVIVTERSDLVRGIELAAGVPPRRDLSAKVVVLSPERVSEIDWAQTTLLIWQGNYPEGDLASLVQRHLANGRPVLFLPPLEPSSTEFLGWLWTAWEVAEGTGWQLDYWNNDSDLWMKTRDGQALPLDDLRFYRCCRMEGPGRTLAQLPTADRVLVRSPETGGAMYALATLPGGAYSSMDRDGIALFVLLQRALANGAESQGAAKSLEAGSLAAQRVLSKPRVNREASGEGAAPQLQSLKPFQAGVYGGDTEWIALNRPLAEETHAPLTQSAVEELFANLDFKMISDQLASERSLASEIWKSFVILALVALLVEAYLSLPDKPAKSAAVSGPASGSGRAAA